MRTGAGWLAVGISLAAGCAGAAPEPHRARARAPSTPVLATAAPPAEPTAPLAATSSSPASPPTPASLLAVVGAAGVPTPSLGPLVVDPPVRPFDDSESMMDHCHEGAVGWALDGSMLGCCFDSPGDEGDACVAGDGRHRVPDARRQIAARHLTSTSPPWPWAGTLDVVWQSIEGDQVGNPRRPGVLRVGARVRGEAPSFPIALSDPDGYHDRIHLELAAVSPDGKSLGVIAHAFACEWADSFPMAVVPIDELASLAFNDAGFARHRAGQLARAARLFETAVAIDPRARLARYNLACAYARLGDARVKDALAQAVALGGEEAKRRARVDRDFDAVRGEAWFADLVR
jgi:hypothetical protein